MRPRAKLALALICVFSCCGLWSQEKPRQRTPHAALRKLDAEADSDRTLSQDDRLSVIAAALDAKSRSHSEPDCSHLVHAIYEQGWFLLCLCAFFRYLRRHRRLPTGQGA